eukprot:85890-Chlamydomonas_euryale.AAC.1
MSGWTDVKMSETEGGGPHADSMTLVCVHMLPTRIPACGTPILAKKALHHHDCTLGRPVQPLIITAGGRIDHKHAI